MKQWPLFALLALSACDSETGLTIDPGDNDLDSEALDTTIDVIDGDAPIALCTVDKNPVQPPFETATFDGSASYDPSGGTIEGYEWALVAAPNGNGVALSSRSGATTSLTPQLAGTYRVELTVINNLGIRSEEACAIELQANPDEDLWVEMFWSHSGDDMDLHLLRPGGSLESGNDCFWENCTPDMAWFFPLDWGVQGVTEDNPTLDLDDISGVGPENINISDPEAGAYTVVVHDFPGSVRDAATSVTVNIYLGGEQVWTDTRSISGEDSYTNFASVNPTTGVVNPM